MDLKSFVQRLQAAQTKSASKRMPTADASIKSALSALDQIGQQFEKQSKRVEEDLRRGAHITKHRINL